MTRGGLPSAISGLNIQSSICTCLCTYTLPRTRSLEVSTQGHGALSFELLRFWAVAKTSDGLFTDMCFAEGVDPHAGA